MSGSKSNTANKQFVTLDNLDLSGGFACDFETGICGPIDEMKSAENNQEEKKNANNNMV
jgi:hypothetical protein